MRRGTSPTRVPEKPLPCPAAHQKGTAVSSRAFTYFSLPHTRYRAFGIINNCPGYGTASSPSPLAAIICPSVEL